MAFSANDASSIHLRSLLEYHPALTKAAKEVDLVPALLVVGALLLVLYPAFASRTKFGIPIVGYGSIFEPAWFSRLRFIRGGRSILKEGYNNYRDMFVIRRVGVDVVVFGEHKYLEEVRAKTKDQVRSVEPFLDDLAGRSMNQGNAFLESDLQNRVLQHRLTPNLGNLVPAMKEELDFALQAELPKSDAVKWAEVDAIHSFSRSIARIVARLWIGPDECRNEDWLLATTEYTENIFITGFILRFVPVPIRPYVARLLPSYHKVMKGAADARRIVGGLASKRKDAGYLSDNTAMKPEDVLQWTMDFASPAELEESNLAERILVLSLSGIHTTALTMAQALFDLCAHPEDMEIIRAELIQVLRSEGAWNKDTLNKLVKLDSLLKESQRFNAVFLMTFNRFLPKPVTLSNGVHLPARTRIAVAQNAILNDPANVPGPNPDKYDPWRYSRLREDPQNANKYQFSMSDPTHMAFGYGKYACPGRFFVSQEIKMTLAHLLLKFDWQFPEGQGRPQNFTIDGDMYPDPTKKVLMRERAVEEDIAHLL